MNDYLYIKNILKAYNSNQVLDGVSISLKKNQIASIIGKSGAGKTTLFNILAGFESPDSGEVFINGIDVTNSKKNISYMTQKSLLLPYLNVLDNVCISFRVKQSKYHKNKQSAYDIAIPILKQFGLFDHAYKYPAQLSGGMKQRVAFIRAFLKESDLLLFDEPFSALDTFTKQSIYKWFINMYNKSDIFNSGINPNKTIIFITHDISEAIYLSDKVFVLDNSKIILELDIKKPSNLSNFTQSEEFFSYYNQIINLYE
ncbi:MAG: ABC transporter ATP-binding protein [bacterium]